MGLFLEMLFRLIFEGTLSAKNKEKASLWFRIPLIILFTGLTVGAMVAIAVFGFYVLKIRDDNSQLVAGVGLLVLDAAFIISALSKMIKYVRKKIEAKKQGTDI